MDALTFPEVSAEQLIHFFFLFFKALLNIIGGKGAISNIKY